MSSRDYEKGFSSGLDAAFEFLYMRVGASETVRDTCQRFKEFAREKEVELHGGDKKEG